jgi:NAD(P)-dependent dehydrogenase (short-subunit alcohol dehydrogenase family)
LVTGASSGIGECAARLLASEGYRVALLARRADRLHGIEAELHRDGSGPHLVLPCDLRDETALRAAMQRVEASFGALDLLVNSAGVGCRAEVAELRGDMIRDVLEVNITGLLLVCREAQPLLSRGQESVLVNVASVVARRGIPGQAVYAASKAAVASIGEALRIEWAPRGISVCTLFPALTRTDFFAAQVNPARLPDPDFARAHGPEDVAREILDLDRTPRPERYLRWKWRWLAALTILSPRWADRILVQKLGGSWQAPEYRRTARRFP